MKGGNILKPKDNGDNGNNLCWLNAPLYVFLSDKRIMADLANTLFETHESLYYNELSENNLIKDHLNKSPVKTLEGYYNSDKILTAKQISEIANLKLITKRGSGPDSGKPVEGKAHVFKLNNFLHMHNRVLSMIKLIEYRNDNIWNGETYRKLVTDVFGVLSENKLEESDDNFKNASELTHILMDIFNGKIFNEVKITKTDYFKFEEKLYRPINEELVWSQISNSLLNRNDGYNLLGMIVGVTDISGNITGDTNLSQIHTSVDHYISIIPTEKWYKFDGGKLYDVEEPPEELLNPKDGTSKYIGLILHNPNPIPY